MPKVSGFVVLKTFPCGVSFQSSTVVLCSKATRMSNTLHQTKNGRPSQASRFKKTSNLSGVILACLRIKCPPVGKTANMSNYCNSLYASGLQETSFHSPLKHFQFASLHLVICVTLPCNLRQITSLFASLHALIDVVSHPHSLSLTAS